MADKEFKYEKWGTKFGNLDEAFKYMLDGTDYDIGQLEAMEREIDKLKLVVSKLTKILYNTDLLTKEEVTEILDA
jgi:hypothetical protein